jgi:site-specific DNA recombinase
MKKIKGCKNPNYRVEELDTFILDEIRSLRFDEGKIEEIMGEVRPQREDPVPALRKELKTTERKISRLLGLYASDLDIDAEDLASQIKPLYEARDRLRKEIEELMKEKHPSGYLTEKQVRERLRDVDVLDGLDLARKRALVNDLIERIVLHEKAGEMTIYWRF